MTKRKKKRKVRIDRKWSDDETDFLYNNYGILSAKEFSAQLNRSEGSITARLHVLRNSKQMKPQEENNDRTKRKWSDDETNFLINNYGILPVEELSAQLNCRSESSVRLKLRRLRKSKQLRKKKAQKEKVRTIRKWSDDETNFLISNYSLLSAKEFSAQLNRPANNIHAKLRHLRKLKQLKQQEGKVRAARSWSDDEINFLTSNYGLLPAKELSAQLNRTVHTVYTKLWHLRKSTQLVKRKKLQTERVKKLRDWSDDEINFLISNYGTLPVEECSVHLNRTVCAIKARLYFLRKSKQLEGKGEALKKWSDDETNFLISNYGILSVEEFSAQLNRTVCAIKARLHLLRHSKQLKLQDGQVELLKRWSGDEIKFLISNYDILSPEEFSVHLNRTVCAIKAKLYLLRKSKQLAGHVETAKKWSDEETNFLISNYPILPVKELSAQLNRTENAVSLKLHDLRKSKQIIKKERCRVGSELPRGWSDDEVNFLINNYGKLSVKKLSAQLNRTKSAVSGRLHDLRKSKQITKKEKGRAKSKLLRRWSAVEINFLINNYGKLSADELSVQLNRSKSAVAARLQNLCKSKQITRIWKSQRNAEMKDSSS